MKPNFKVVLFKKKSTCESYKQCTELTKNTECRRYPNIHQVQCMSTSIQRLPK